MAAGAGARFGMPKVLADNGNWLRAGVAALCGGGCDDVVVVLGAAVVAVPPPARAIVADDWADGLSASLRTGINAIADAPETAGYVVVCTIDTPDVGPDVVRRVLAAARRSPTALARARYRRRPGHPVVIGRRHWPALLAGLTGDEGARAFLHAHRTDVVAVDCADLASGLDVDVSPER